MVRIFSLQQIRQIEEAANESGITYLRLMENAGSACAKIIRNKFDDSLKVISNVTFDPYSLACETTKKYVSLTFALNVVFNDPRPISIAENLDSESTKRSYSV